MNRILEKIGKKALLLIVFVLVTSTLMAACGKKASPTDLEVVATVNDLEDRKSVV